MSLHDFITLGKEQVSLLTEKEIVHILVEVSDVIQYLRDSGVAQTSYGLKNIYVHPMGSIKFVGLLEIGDEKPFKNLGELAVCLLT